LDRSLVLAEEQTHHKEETEIGIKKSKLASGSASSLHAASPLARLFVVGMLLQFAKQAALLQLHVEALKGRVNRLIGLDIYVNQAGS